MRNAQEPRATIGVACSLSRSGADELVLHFDDVANESGTTTGPWVHQNPYTELGIRCPDGDLLGSLSEQDLANIGLALMARLSALQGTGPEKT